jgi:hypothetical protein
MKIFRWALVFILVGLSGCCSHPGVFDKLHQSMVAVQNFYGPLTEGLLEQNDKVHMAVVAADTTLLLAGELQQQWCPDPEQAAQVELQAKQAQNLAQEAGVAAAAPATSAAPAATETPATAAAPAAPETPAASAAPAAAPAADGK